MEIKQFTYSVAIFCVGSLALALPSGYSIGFYGVALSGLFLSRGANQCTQKATDKFFYLPLIMYAAVQLVIAGSQSWTLSLLNDAIPFLLVPFGFWLLRWCKPHISWFWSGLACGALIGVSIAAYQGVMLGVRAGGYLHWIQFGNIALLLGVLCLVRLLCVPHISFSSGLMLLGAVAGLVTSIFSQTRGGWIAFFFVLGWVGFYVSKRISRIKRSIYFLSLVVLLGLPFLGSNNLVQNRVDEAIREVQAFIEHDQQDTSVGARLAMWRLGIKGIADKPLLGQGLQGWIELRDASIAKGELTPMLARFTQLHNEFLNVAFKSGLIGLAFLLAMYLVPMLYFFKPYLNHDNPEVRALAMAGMVIPMMYMDFGLTQSFLTHNSGRVVLCSLWMCVAALMLNAAEGHEVQT